MMRKLAILGSTGSIGTQALEVVRWHSDRLKVVALTAFSNGASLKEQVEEFEPQIAALLDSVAVLELADALRDSDCRVLGGPESLLEIAALESADIILIAVPGAAGLLPTLRALESGKVVALANKETLVAGGSLVNKTLESGGMMLPVDSEHSALFQCLIGEESRAVRRLTLTASGGPFRNKTLAELERVTVGEALAHPTWDMGPKVTIDSATLMNKGLEIIEAHWLFGVSSNKINVVVHPESIVHSLVEFVDGSVKAQLSWPDMRLPIQYALLYPERMPTKARSLDLVEATPMNFEQPDDTRFPCLRLAREAAVCGGTMPAVLNAANEVAVEAFLSEEIWFMDIPRIVEEVMAKHDALAVPSLDDIIQTDRWARDIAREQSARLSRLTPA